MGTGYGDAAHAGLLRGGWRWSPMKGTYEREFAPDEWLVLSPVVSPDEAIETQREGAYMLFLEGEPRLWIATFENIKEAGRCLRQET